MLRLVELCDDQHYINSSFIHHTIAIILKSIVWLFFQYVICTYTIFIASLKTLNR